MKQIRETWPDDVRIVAHMRPLPFHDRARPVALAAIAAHRQGKFWEFHDLVFERKKFAEEDVRAIAQEIGLDMERWEADRASAEVAAVVDRHDKACQRIGASGTPTLFVNGRKLTGAKPFEEFKKTIDAEIAKVDAIIAAGVPADNAPYVAMARNDRKVFDHLVRLVPAAKPPPAPKEIWKVKVRGDEPMKGNTKDPLVTIVEWSDFQ